MRLRSDADGFELVDDADAAGESIFEGLGLVPLSIAPHFRTPGEAGETIQLLVDHFEDTGRPYRALRDGEAIVVRAAPSRRSRPGVGSDGLPKPRI